MKSLFLGSSPLTSIAGYLLAGLTTADALLKGGETDWRKIGIAVSIAILGRVCADANQVTNK